MAQKRLSQKGISSAEGRRRDARPTWLDYFAGGVPTGGYFRITTESLRELTHLQPNRAGVVVRLHEICLIGLMAYFEAFCKDHFASVINIEPRLVNSLKANGQSVTIEATNVLLFGKDIERRIGFLLAEKFDFGSAQKINALFGALLKVTPFNKKEAQTYNRLLRDRNLLVHHGGTFTLTYLEDLVDSKRIRSDAFFHSVVININELSGAITFIEEIAKKLLRASHASILDFLLRSPKRYSAERQKALDALVYWD
ncbi:MAG: hypothetical protein QOE77_3686 [Blastocatellia bacterium]|nr:hypothetical protein [Blastocatellia bacterium]